MTQFLCLLLVPALLWGCGDTPIDAPDEPPPPPKTQPASQPTSQPASLAVEEPLPPLPAPRILSGVQLRMPRKNPEKSTAALMQEMNIQIFFPRGVPRPTAGELADVVGPKGYRFLARIVHVREEIDFQPIPFLPKGLGYYAKLVPLDHFGEGFESRIENAIALIPSLPERRARIKAAPNPPDLNTLPPEVKSAKLFSYADSDGDGEIDAVAASGKGDCRYGLFKEKDLWQMKRSFCGKNPN